MTKRLAASFGLKCCRPPASRTIVDIRPGGLSTLTRGRAHGPGLKLVVLFVVQFAISCLLALLPGQYHHNQSLISHAIPAEAAWDQRGHGQVGSTGQFRLREPEQINVNEPQKETAVRFTRGGGGNIELHNDALEGLLRLRPRWRVNPSATSFQDGRTRHNRFLTIEDQPMAADLAPKRREQGGTRPEVTPVVTEEDSNTRRRRDQQQRRQQQQATSSTTGNMNDTQRQHIKTRLENKLIEIRQRYLTNRAITDRAYYILLIIYAILITFGTISNSLICLTVIFKPKILSPRNLFIVNLAGSDLLLCVFTMPLTFIEVSMKIWQMGLIPCKLVAGLQATSIFVSTISITAIALDRYKVIVFPTHQETASGTRGALLLLASVWIGALAISLPLFTYRTVEHHAITSPTNNQSEAFNLRPPSRLAPDSGQSANTLDYGNSGSLANQTGHKLDLARAAQQQQMQLLLLQPTSSTTQNPTAGSSLKQYPNQLVDSFDFCIEDWPFAHGRGVFSVVSMFLQYVLPISIVSFVYTKISRKLQKRLIRRQRLTQLECQQKRQLNLIKRTHTMLVSVSLVFGFSWLPLNLWNVASDFSAEFRKLFDDQTFRIIFAVCHLIGCSSACSNPILYGFLNENFRKELQQVYNHHARLLLRRIRRLLDWLSRCWLIRRLFACCGLPVEVRNDVGAGGESEDEVEGETSKLAASRASIKHINRLVSESSTRFEGAESSEAPHHQHVARSISSYSSNFSTEGDEEEEEDDDDDDSGSAFYSEPLASRASGGADAIASLLLRPNSAIGAEQSPHEAHPNVIPLSLMNLTVERDAEQKLRKASNLSDRIERPRAESTPCPDLRLDSPRMGGERCNVVGSLKRVDNQMSNSRRRLERNDSVQRRRRNQVSRMASDRVAEGGDDGGDKLVGATALQMNDAKDQSRRVSYQTIISAGRDDNRTIGGRAMRLCLCISSSSSTETIDGQATGVAAGAHQATPNGLDSGSMLIPKRFSDARGETGEVRASGTDRTGDQRGGHRGQQQQHQRQQLRRRRKRQQQAFRERPTQLKCECQCHRVEKLTQVVADYDTRSLCEPARISQSTRSGAAEGLEAKCQTKTMPATTPTTLAGRRVWLRFLGGHGAQNGDQPNSSAMTSGDGKSEHNQGGPQIKLYADHADRPASRPAAPTGPDQAMHRSQPDLFTRLVEHKARAGVVSDGLCDGAIGLTVPGNNNNSFGSTNERNQSSGTIDDTSASRLQQHCNICKHSSVSSAPGRLLPASAAGQRRLNRKRANQTRQSSLLRRRKLRASEAGQNSGSRGDASLMVAAAAAALRPAKRTMTSMQVVEQPCETVATAAVKRSQGALSSIGGWISGLRRKRSSRRRAASKRAGDMGGAGCGGSQLNQAARGGDARSSSGGISGAGKCKTASADFGAKFNRSVSSSSTAANNNNTNHNPNSPAQTSNAAMRNTLDQSRAPVLIVGPAGPTTPIAGQMTTLDPGGAQATRQVGTVYLSIEMGDNRQRADSIFSFDGTREKSTSVVVMMAEDDDEPEEMGEGVKGPDACCGPIRTADSRRTNASDRVTTATTTSTTPTTRPMNVAISQISNQLATDGGGGGENGQRRRQKLDSADDYCESKISQNSLAIRGIARDDNFIDCCPADSQKLATADDVNDGELQSKDNQRPSEPNDGLDKVGRRGIYEDNGNDTRNRSAPASSSAEGAGDETVEAAAMAAAAAEAAAIATSTPPITVRSSNSSGSVSPSALSFTSACLLHHSSSVSSCTCSLTTSSFSSGQLTATNTTTATTRESSMSISTQATLSMNISPRNSVPSQQQQQQHIQTAHQHQFQPQAARNQPIPEAASGGPTTIKTTREAISSAARPEQMAWHRSVSSGSSRAVPTSRGRHRSQRHLDLRQSRTHSATLGSDLGRAARAAALAAARCKSLRSQAASDGAPPPQPMDEWPKPATKSASPSTSSKVDKMSPTRNDSNCHLSSSSAGIGAAQIGTQSASGAALDKQLTLSTAIVLASLQIEPNRASSSAMMKGRRRRGQSGGSSFSLAAASEEAGALKVESKLADDII